MSKKLLSALVAASFLASSAARTVEIKGPEDDKIEKKASWTSVQYQKARKAAENVPAWAWWTAGGILSVAAIAGVSVYYYKTGGVLSFLSWNSRPKVNPQRKPEGTIPPLPHNTPAPVLKEKETGEKEEGKEKERETERTAGQEVEKLQRDLRRVRDAVVDLEREAYGTTFLDGSPKVSVDGKDIFIIKPTDGDPV